MKRVFYFLLIITLFISGAGCGKKTSHSPVPDNVIATIDDYYVFRNEFLFFVQLNYRDILEKKDQFILSRILDDYIKRRMIYLYLKEKNLLPKSDDIAEYIKFHKLERYYNSLDLKHKRYFVFFIILELDDEIFKNYLISEYVRVSDREIKDYYENKSEDFIKKKTYCFSRFHSKYKDLMEDARKWIVRKKRDENFVRFRYRDIDVESNCYNDDEIPEEFLKVLKKLRVGRVSKVIKIKIGTNEDYNMFWLKKVIPARKLKFEEVKDMIYNKIEMKKYSKVEEKVLKQINKKYRVMVYPSNILIFRYNGVFPVYFSEAK